MQRAMEQFKEGLAKIHALEHALGVMQYDFETAMPRGAGEDYAKTVGALSEEVYRRKCGPEFKALAGEIAHDGEADPVARREAEVLLEEIGRMDCIPVEEFVAYEMEQSLASGVWHRAKVENDYAAFLPHLSKLLEFKRRFALYYAPEGKPYDTMLDEYEKGMTTEALDGYFAMVRQRLTPLVEQTAARSAQIDDGFLYRNYPLDGQRALSDYLMRAMTIDRDFCTIGEVEHPFTTNFSKHDVRITTHYYENAVASSLYSVIHEGGHALYELNTGDELVGSPLAGGVSMGIHESQSRLFENLIGRSEAFVGAIFPKMQALFPAQLRGVSARDFYRAVNKSTPSLIRTEADELTYSLHVMVRYELEKRMVDGALDPRDLPGEWNRLYKEYLGVDVPDDTRGVLQDSHWSGGSFGYFPSYAIGSAYGAQFMDAMRKDLDVDAVAATGCLAPIVEWLTQRIYRFGRLKTPGELILETCKEEFNPRYYIEYLERKYAEIYGL